MASRSTVLRCTALTLFAASAMRAAPARRLIVRSTDTPVRERCGEAALILARLASGRELMLRFAVDLQNLRVHIGNLRKKIEADPGDPKHILTVTAVGYRLAAETP